MKYFQNTINQIIHHPFLFRVLEGGQHERHTSPIQRPTIAEIHRERAFPEVSSGDAILIRTEALRIQTSLREGQLDVNQLSIEQRDILDLAEMLSQNETSYCFSNVITLCTERYSLRDGTPQGNPRFLSGMETEKNEDPLCGYEAHIEMRKMPITTESGNVEMIEQRVLRMSLGNHTMLDTAKTFLHNPERRVMGLLSEACDFIEIQFGHETFLEPITPRDKASHIRPRSGLNVNFSQLVEKLGRHDFEEKHLEAHIHADHIEHLEGPRVQKVLEARNLVAKKVHDLTAAENIPEAHHIFHIHHREKPPANLGLYAPQEQLVA